jgi:hypothetical protein
MRTPAPDQLLDAWDAGCALPPMERTLPLLRAAGEPDGDGPLELSLGERERLLVALRERLFGQVLSARASCPACAVALELTVSTSDLLAAASVPERPCVRAGGFVVRCRPLRPADLVDAGATGSAGAARELLVSRAVLTAEHKGQPVPPAALPTEVVAAVAAALAEADPLADIELPVCCDACGAVWSSPLDIGSYLWQEVDAWARRLLGEVHTLARAYGWSEQQVLGLSVRRRRRYLELVADG